MRTRSLLALAAFLSLSACSMAPPRPEPVAPVRTPPPRPAVACHDCGRIERVEMVSNVRATSSGHAVLGGLVGGIASGESAKPAPAPKANVQVLTFRIGVVMDDGRRLVLHQPELAPGLRSGSRIRVQNSRVVPAR